MRDKVMTWLPWSDPDAFLGGVPAGFQVDRYDAGGARPDSIDTVEFYVPSYMAGQPAYEVITEMPALKVVQTQTAGYEHVLPFLRDDVTLCNARGVHDASTAELAVALILAWSRRIPQPLRDARRDQLERYAAGEPLANVVAGPLR